MARIVSIRFRKSVVRALLTLTFASLPLVGLAVDATPSAAATGGNFIATGHDMDFHCSGGSLSTPECQYLKIVVDKVRNGSTLPILALDQGSELTNGLAAAGEAPVVTVDPANTATFNATAFTNASGTPLYSAIITASDSTCGGCDNTPAGEANINARASDFATFFNKGGGILALSGAGNRATYYNFVPLTGLSAAPVSPPFTVTSQGAALGITSTMANCCFTHNSFNTPPSPFVILETDSAGLAETIAAFGATIGGGGFTGGAPTCAVTGLFAGPPKQQQVTVQDTGSGLNTIENIVITNGTVAVDPFTSGTTAPIHVTASKTDPTKSTNWQFDVVDVAGNRTHCA